ncbi:MAG: N-acetylmuramoyl-L-alanine amidase [Aliivibrio sp.]|uniref:N-acetylmuramoyl-L-alanine amidase n=1 Tax=Aliivibrio sp. TaxID=1872443 RepID=UPI001A55D1D1|nr:N-acetylmuramoyl-L-alanine amidase [Aliivibrio sp.]
MKNKRFWIIDNGHGGFIDGKPVTPGKRSPVWKDKAMDQLIEGDFNRKVVRVLAGLLHSEGIQYQILVTEERDVSLADRVRRVGRICRKHPNAVLVSIHANAGGGKGFEVFTSVGETESDKIATIFCEQYKKDLPDFPLRVDRADGDPDKESNLYILRKTACPAILTENLFMDNKEECKFLLSKEGVAQIAAIHAQAIAKYERGLK